MAPPSATSFYDGVNLNDTNCSEDPMNGSKVCRNLPLHANRHLRVICVGAGASGIYLAYKMKTAFTDFTLDIYEKNPEISGTWYENRYPGCACDVPAHNYTYSFEPKWDWSANYAGSQEIKSYFTNFVEKYGLQQYIRCNHTVIGANWNEHTKEWSITIQRGDGTVFERSCDFFINAAGILNSWRWPTIPGLHDFKGKLVHSANWEDGIDVEGKKVGLIGNGSSGIQILPQIQTKAEHLTTFIRSRTWVSPARGMEYHEYTKEEKEEFRDDPEKHLQLRRETERSITAIFPIFIKGSKPQETIKAQMNEQMKEKINHQFLSKQLIPDFSFGCRRLTPGVNYLESLTKPNVTTYYGEITKIVENGCETDDGAVHPLDILICATGFDTSFRPRFPITGHSGKNLQVEWAAAPRSYLGLAASDFPNYFMFLGPNCPIGNGPIIISIEAQGDYIASFLNRWQKEDIVSFVPKKAAIDDFMEQKDLFMKTTIWEDECSSWYKDPSGSVTALWPGSTMHYLEILGAVRWEDFEVTYRGNRFAYFGNGFSQRESEKGADTAYYIRNEDRGEGVFRPSMKTFNAKDVGDILTRV